MFKIFSGLLLQIIFAVDAKIFCALVPNLTHGFVLIYKGSEHKSPQKYFAVGWI